MSVAYGANQTFTITPATGFQVLDVLVDGVSVGAVTTYTFSGVTADHTIAASFGHAVTASAGVGGSIDPSGTVGVADGADQTFTITPATGYHVLDVLVDGVSVGAVTTYTFSGVTADHTIAASFEINSYTITASAGANGSIDPTGAVSVAYGADQTFTITPATGYHVLDVLVDGVSVGAVTTYTFSGVTADHTIAASFALNSYTITASAGANGSIDPAGAIALSYGADQSFTITPATGYHVLDVLVDGVSVGAVTTYTFSGVTADHTIAAGFALPAPVVAFPNGSEFITQGDTVQIEWDAVPAAVDGDFRIWVYDAGNWWEVTTTPVPVVGGQTGYTFDWTVAQPAGTGYQVRIWYRDELGSWIAFDDSDASFEIAAPPQPLVVGSPNGEEAVVVGAPTTITWSLTDAVNEGDFRIWVYDNSQWYELTQTPVPAEADRTLYSLDWTPLLPTGQAYKVRIWYRDQVGNFLYYDDSDATFELVGPALNVTEPAVGASVTQGETASISWHIYPAPDQGRFRIWVYDSRDWHEVAPASVLVVPGQTDYTFDWVVHQPAGSGYQVRIWYIDGAYNWTSYADSDPFFTIIAPTPTITAPAGGETFTRGDTTTVTWTVDPALTNGSFRIWAYDSHDWHEITAAPVEVVAGRTDYSLDWTITQPEGSDYRLRLWYRDESGSWLCCDDSAGTFAVVQPVLTVTAPEVGGSVIQGSLDTVIRWSVGPAVSAGVFRVWVYDSRDWYEVTTTPVAAVPDKIEYELQWQVSQPLGSDYYVRIWWRDSLGNWVATDGSDGGFSIVSQG